MMQDEKLAILDDERLSKIQKQEILEMVERGIKEDIGKGDVTTLASVPVDQMSTATFLAKQPGVIAGLKVVELVFFSVDSALEVEWLMNEGVKVKKGDLIGKVRGLSSSILSAERLALNIFQRMSGIATLTRKFVDAISEEGSKTVVLDTRKTAPGLRAIDKLSVVLGGGKNHRYGLYDMVLIKDNHVSAAGGVIEAVEKVEQYLKDTDQTDLQIEVEVRTMEELELCISVADKVDRILLDNFVDRKVGEDNEVIVDTKRLEEAVKTLDGQIPAEVSGNVDLDTISAIAKTNVDFVSIGALTHSVKALDLSLKITAIDIDGIKKRKVEAV